MYELVITNAFDLSEDVVGFGDDKATAERVFNWAWSGLVRDGYVSIHNLKNPNLIQFKRGNLTALMIELRDRQPAPGFHAAAFAPEKPMPGGWVAAVILQEQNVQRLKTAQHVAKVVDVRGRSLAYPLADDRAAAIKEFTALVLNQAYKGGKLWRCVDADLKYTVVGSSGSTTLEFVEGGA